MSCGESAGGTAGQGHTSSQRVLDGSFVGAYTDTWPRVDMMASMHLHLFSFPPRPRRPPTRIGIRKVDSPARVCHARGGPYGGLCLGVVHADSLVCLVCAVSARTAMLLYAYTVQLASRQHDVPVTVPKCNQYVGSGRDVPPGSAHRYRPSRSTSFCCTLLTYHPMSPPPARRVLAGPPSPPSNC